MRCTHSIPILRIQTGARFIINQIGYDARKMDELLAVPALPHGQPFGGVFSPDYTGGVEAGWSALATPAEAATTPPAPHSVGLERIQLDVWWITASGRKSMRLETYRRALFSTDDVDWMLAHPQELLGAPL